jgi:hypothetical protein
MYFDDIFKKIEPFWKDEFLLINIDETETYVQSLRENFNEIDNIIYFANKENYSVWESMLAFTMYQVLTAYALNLWNVKKSNILYFKDIPITVFEEYFRKNLEEEGNEDFLKCYQGFKPLASRRVD